MPKQEKIKVLEDDLSLRGILSYLNNQVQVVNNSKIFAGLMIITLNIVSKFVNIKLSRTMEAYLKFSFSRSILVFAIAWMGTRDIYIALFITAVFIVVTEYLLHEDSSFFVLSEDFRDYHLNMLDQGQVTMEEVNRAKEVLERAKLQGLIDKTDNSSFQGFAFNS
jgi:hypothetical protein